MITLIILLIILQIICFVYVKLTRSETINYWLMILLIFVGFGNENTPYIGVSLNVIAVIISLAALLNKNWTISKTLARTLRVLIVILLLQVLFI